VKNLLFVAIFCLIAFSACFALPQEAPLPAPPRLAVPVVVYFATIPVTRGDVELSANPSAVYVPAMVETVQFPRSDVPIGGIFVSVGDEVAAGDIIASLDSPETLRQLEDLEQALGRAQVELQIVMDRRELALGIALETDQPIDESFFNRQINDIRTEKGFLMRQIDHTKSLVESLHLRASIEGVITNVAVFEEGMLSRPTQNIATITNHGYTAFVVRGRFAEYMAPGDRFEMTIGFDVFLMEVIHPDVFGIELRTDGNEAFLVFLDAPPTLTIGMTGTVHMPFERAEQVLMIPTNIIHRTQERTFVYVVENGIRSVRDIVIGLEVNTYIEVTSGLYEGELVTR